MKYIVILGDGMSDFPDSQYNNITPLAKAKKPNIDGLAAVSELGLCKTVPDSMSPGSDTANLSVLGYSPVEFFTGRSPLEAISMGIDFTVKDVAMRCNLVTLSDERNFANKRMIDYSAGEIPTFEAREIITFLNMYLSSNSAKLYSGTSYRNCLMLKDSPLGAKLIPPHDISGRIIGEYLPAGVNSELLLNLMQRASVLLNSLPVNLRRIQRGLNPANGIWFWGEGRKPALPSFKEKYGLSGAVVSAVDLIKGIGKAAGMKILEVEGADGTLNTNYKGKAEAAVKALKKDMDFVFLHVEAPDECGHRGEYDCKVKAIEKIDKEIVGYILEKMKGEDISLLIMPDHPTPVATRTHSRDMVPYLLYRSSKSVKSKASAYTEASCKAAKRVTEEGHTLIQAFLK